MTSYMASSGALFTPDEMGRADALTIKAGTPGHMLMLRAGYGAADYILHHFPDCQSAHILTGPGNNGGDGFVIAECLKQAGWQIEISSLVPIEKLKGDAALAAEDCTCPVVSFAKAITPDLYVDALFGAGLTRPLTGQAEKWVGIINDSGAPIVAIDLPSGIDGKSGAILGCASEADITLTFHAKKPGHLLYPGRAHCGLTEVIDIGLLEDTEVALEIRAFENTPHLWAEALPLLRSEAHKYSRGSALIISGGEFATGASRLCAKAALRVGAGLVSIAGDEHALRVHAAHLTAIMLKPAQNIEDLRELLTDTRISALAIGPGLGLDEEAKTKLGAVLDWGKSLTLDADAITLLSHDQDKAFAALKACIETPILTPHEGEFTRLFGKIDAASKLERARIAAKQSGSVIVYKGADTVIAVPDGLAAINSNAPPWLATAGSGDVLAGIITGLRAQGMPAFEAACAGVWLHGEAGNLLGPGLTADDLDEGLFQAFNLFLKQLGL